MLFWNRWNEETAGRVYFNISRETPLTPDTPHVHPLWCELEWTSLWNILIIFCWNQSETILFQGSPELFLPGYHAQKSSGVEIVETQALRVANGAQ